MEKIIDFIIHHATLIAIGFCIGRLIDYFFKKHFDEFF
jgi:hypothetical protein